MKRIALTILSILLCIMVASCGNDSELPTSISPSDFSKETEDALEIFADELQYYDIVYDDTAKSRSIAVSIYSDGEWVEVGKSYGNVDESSERIAIQLAGDSFELYRIEKDGHEKSGYPSLGSGIESATAFGSTRIDEYTELTIGEETPIWVKLGYNGSSTNEITLDGDFREYECDYGIAVTITVYDVSAE